MKNIFRQNRAEQSRAEQSRASLHSLNSKFLFRAAFLVSAVVGISTVFLNFDKISSYPLQYFKTTGESNDTVRSGQPLTVAKWNKIIGTLSDLTSEIFIDQANHRVAIGTNSFSDQTTQFQVQGKVRVNGLTDTTTLEVAGDTKIDTNTFFVDAVNDRVGIGTTNPRAKLEIVSVGSPVQLQFKDGDVSGNTWWIGTDANTDLAIGEGAQSTANGRLYIKTGGNVGIGTTNPTQKLEVNGTVKIAGTGSGLTFPDGTTQTTAAIYKGVSIYLTNAIPLAYGHNIIPFTSESFDTNNFHDNMFNASRITIPNGLGGKYLVRCSTSWAQSSGGVVSAFIKKNGLDIFKVRTSPSGADSDEVSAGRVVMAGAGDYLECDAYTNAYSKILISGEVHTWFEITYLGL